MNSNYSIEKLVGELKPRESLHHDCGNGIYLSDNQIEVLKKYGFSNYDSNIKSLILEIEEYLVFMKETGLKDLIQNHIINNLVDYAFGVEVGLDSNGRKNRGGHLMEDLLEKHNKKLIIR